jgi:hypothetical protein
MISDARQVLLEVSREDEDERVRQIRLYWLICGIFREEAESITSETLPPYVEKLKSLRRPKDVGDCFWDWYAVCTGPEWRWWLVHDAVEEILL